MATDQFLIYLIFLTVAVMSHPEKEEGRCYGNYGTLFGPRCCGNEKFSYHHLKEFSEECNVPPKNESMPLAASYWKFFDCLLTNYLDTKPLTLQNFAMTTNLSSETRTAILSNLTTSDSQILKENNSNEDNFDYLSKLWTLYFDAEYHVCNTKREEMLAKQNLSRTYNLFTRQYWDPAHMCQNVSHPLIPVEDHGNWWESMEDCGKMYRQKFQTNWTHWQSEDCISGVCSAIALGRATEDELKSGPPSTINYDTQVQNLVPHFVSKSVRDQFMSNLKMAMAHLVNGTDSDSIGQSIEKSRKSFQDWTKDNGIVEGLKNVCVESKILQRLRRVSWTAERKNC